MAVIDGAEVAKHKTDKDCWVVINGKVWDVSGRFARSTHVCRQKRLIKIRLP